MSDALDLLLEQVREDEPSDDLFVQRVMTQVRKVATPESETEAQMSGRGRRLGRHPFAVGIAAAVIVTGGAVAAYVGSNPSEESPSPQTSAPTTITSKPPIKAPDTAAPRESTVAAPAPPPSTPVAKARGYLTEHTSYAFDGKTGLRLVTETYTTEFVAGKEQRVTLTLENTGAKALEFTTPEGCGLQVRAVTASGDVGAAYNDPNGYTGQMEWVCAGSDSDPRLAQTSEAFVLEPGERRRADAYVALDEGSWNLFGVCRCTYKQAEDPTPAPRADPLAEVLKRSLPSPALPELPTSEKSDLATPPIGVRAS